jgi:Tfp pilus assembly protein PilP
LCCRWDRIAELMERYPWEVTKMAGLIKNNPSLVPISSAKQGVTGRYS